MTFTKATDNDHTGHMNGDKAFLKGYNQGGAHKTVFMKKRCS